MRKAVFLDRDGVINSMIFNQERNEYEPPHRSEDVIIYDYAAESLRKLANRNFDLFIVSNQPDFAKGKTTLENLKLVKETVHEYFKKENVFFTGEYYCFHHPEGIVKEFSFDCDCRKPKTFFVDSAIEKYNIIRGLSWMIGDRESDIKLGINAGLKTVLIKSNYYHTGTDIRPQFIFNNLLEAAEFILKNN